MIKQIQIPNNTDNNTLIDVEVEYEIDGFEDEPGIIVINQLTATIFESAEVDVSELADDDYWYDIIVKQIEREE